MVSLEEENNKLDLEIQELLYLKEYYKRLIPIRTKKEVIYIITNDINLENNIFELGRTKLNNLKRRLAVYNRDAIEPYYFVYYKEIFGGEIIEKIFYDNMKFFNVNDDKHTYRLYLPDFEFYLEKAIELDDDIQDHLEENHKTVISNSLIKKSIVTPLAVEEVIKKIKENNKEIKAQSLFDSLPLEEQTNILRPIIDNLEIDISRKDLEEVIKSNHNLVINKKMPFWNLVKEITKDNDRIKITFR